MLRFVPDFNKILHGFKENVAPSEIVKKPRKNLFVQNFNDIQKGNDDDVRDDNQSHKSSDAESTTSSGTSGKGKRKSRNSKRNKASNAINDDECVYIDLSNSPHRLELIEKTKPKQRYEIEDKKLKFSGANRHQRKLKELENLMKISKEPANIEVSNDKMNKILKLVHKNLEFKGLLIDNKNNLISWDKATIFLFKERIEKHVKKIDTKMNYDKLRSNSQINQELIKMNRTQSACYFHKNDKGELVVYGLDNFVYKAFDEFKKSIKENEKINTEKKLDDKLKYMIVRNYMKSDIEKELKCKMEFNNDLQKITLSGTGLNLSELNDQFDQFVQSISEDSFEESFYGKIRKFLLYSI